MFFALSKIFWTLVQPLNALCLLALAGLVLRMRWKQTGQGLMNLALILILILGFIPVGPLLIGWLERQYPTPSVLPAEVDGIIVLGGAFDSYLSQATGQIVANDQVDRMFCFVNLARQYPKARLLFSGGPGDILNPAAMESHNARDFFMLTKLDTGRVIYEEKSRNTYENAVFSKELMKPEKGQNWIVTTSAFHMPRTVGVFEQVGWKIIPYQCDPKTDGTLSVLRRLPGAAGNFQMLNLSVKELLGLAVYYVTGKSAFIIPPGPVESGDEENLP